MADAVAQVDAPAIAGSAGTLLCPRCGYDVSGPTPTWSSAGSCPLEGTCSECGLRFEWVDLFRPERVYPLWSFEHAKHRRFRAFFITLFRSLLPGRFWTTLRMSSPVRPARLVILVILCLLACHLIAITVGMKVNENYLWATAWRVPPGGAPIPTSTFSWPLFTHLAAWPYHVELSPWGGWSRLVGPLGQLGLLWGLLAPLPYFILEQTMATAKVRKLHLLRGALCFIPTLAAFLLIDIAMMTVPRLNSSWMWSGATAAAWTALGIIAFLLAAAWIIRWWLIFTKSYLQLPRPRAVAAAMMTIAFLASLIISLFTDEALRQMLGHWLNGSLGWNAY